MIQEQWIAIKDYPDYAVSNLGRVRRETNACRTNSGRILKTQLNKRGYPCAALRNLAMEKKQLRPVHALVAEAFIGERPKGMTVNHKDGIKTNNTPHNLEYMTILENIEHARITGLILSGNKHPSHLRPDRLPRGASHHAVKNPELMARGEKHGMSKITREQAIDIKKRLFNGAIAMQLAREYSVSEGLIQGIKHGRTWAHIVITPQDIF